MINQQNYEAWFLDFLEGNLSTKQTKILLKFLDNHPTLKAELDVMELIILPTSTDLFPDKNSLKKTVTIGLGLTEMDSLLIGQLENNLSTSEQKNLQHSLSQNPKLRLDQKLYQLTYLKPDLSVKHPNKSTLTRANKRIISIGFVVRSAAIVLLLVAAIMALRQGVGDKNVPTPIVATPVNDLDLTPIIPTPIKEIKSSEIVLEKQKPRHQPIKAPVAAPFLPTPVLVQSNKGGAIALEKISPIPQPKPVIPLAIAPHNQDTLRIQRPELKPILPVCKPLLALKPKAKTPRASTRKKIDLSSPKKMALLVVDRKIKTLTGQAEKTAPLTLVEAVISSIETVSKNKVKIKTTRTKKRSGFRFSVGRFAVSHSRSRS